MGRLVAAFAVGVLVAGSGTLLWTKHPSTKPVFVLPASAPTTEFSPLKESRTLKTIYTPTPSRAIKVARRNRPVADAQPGAVTQETASSYSQVAAAPAPAPAPNPVTAQQQSPVETPQPVPPVAEPRKPRIALVPAGTLLTVRLLEPLSSNQTETGYVFTASLDHPLVINNLVLAERGAQQLGKVVLSGKGGRVKGSASLSLELTELSTADGQRVAIQTETFVHQADSPSGWNDAAKAGAGAAIGAAIGAMAGGGKGAGIGAAVGGAAGVGSILLTRGPEAKLEEETRISFRLKEPIALTERVN